MKKQLTIWQIFFFLLITASAHAATSTAGLPFEDVPRTVFSSLSGDFLYYTLLIGALVLLWAWGHSRHHSVVGEIIEFLVLAAIATHLTQIASVFKWSGALC